MEELKKTGTPVSADYNQPVPKGAHYIIITFDDGYQSILKNALPAMRERNIPATIFVVTGFLGRKPGWITDPCHPNANELLMTEEQLKEFSAHNITIGSHSVSHPHLTNVDISILKKELADSKKKLEDLLQKEISLLALPYGAIDRTKVEYFKEAGYERVFLNIPTFPATFTDRYFIGRIDTDPDDWMIEYKLKLKGAYQWLPWAIKIKRSMKRLVQRFFGKSEVYS